MDNKEVSISEFSRCIICSINRPQSVLRHPLNERCLANLTPSICPSCQSQPPITCTQCKEEIESHEENTGQEDFDPTSTTSTIISIDTERAARLPSFVVMEAVHNAILGRLTRIFVPTLLFISGIALGAAFYSPCPHQ
jgi:hypothetical protein